MRLGGPARSPRGGFTLAEVMVALVLVGGYLVYALMGLNVSKMTAAHTHNLKLARELGLYTLGQLEAGLFWEDMDDTIGPHSYAELDPAYADFEYTIYVGQENFELATEDPEQRFDSLGYADDEDDDDDEEEEKRPYVEVMIRVTFPKLVEFPNQLILERWIPWEQVHGEGELTELEAPERP